MSTLITLSYKIINRRFATADDLQNELLEHHKNVIKKLKYPLSKKDSINTYIVPSDIDTPYCVVKTILPAKATLLFEYLVEDLVENVTEWNITTTEANLIEKISSNESIIQILSKVPVLKVREDLFYQYRFNDNNKAFYEFSTGAIHEKVLNCQTNKVRSKLYFCSKEIIPVDEYHSQYTAIWQYNPGGILNQFLSQETLAGIILKNLVQECIAIKNILEA